MSPTRWQLCGPEAVAHALASGEPVQLLLVARAPRDPRVLQVADEAAARGVAVHRTSDAMLWRLGKVDPPAEVLALLGPAPDAPREDVLAAGGALWLLVACKYRGNTGFAIRNAEVSGADGIFVDNDFTHDARREAIRASMRADRYFPVFWEPADRVIADARAAGRRVYAIEDVGDRAPWQVDLTPPTLLIVGGEKSGIPEAALEACDGVLRIPMRGFIPSYNLQAAMAMVAGERIRQLEAGAG